MNQIIKTMHGDCNYCLNQHSGLDGPCKGCAFSVKQKNLLTEITGNGVAWWRDDEYETVY